MCQLRKTISIMLLTIHFSIGMAKDQMNRLAIQIDNKFNELFFGVLWS